MTNYHLFINYTWCTWEIYAPGVIEESRRTDKRVYGKVEDNNGFKNMRHRAHGATYPFGEGYVPHEWIIRTFTEYDEAMAESDKMGKRTAQALEEYRALLEPWQRTRDEAIKVYSEKRAEAQKNHLEFCNAIHTGEI